MRRFPLSPDAGFLRKSSKLLASEGAIHPSGTVKPVPESTRFKDGSRAVLIVKQGGPAVSAGWMTGYWRDLWGRFGWLVEGPLYLQEIKGWTRTSGKLNLEVLWG